MKIKLISLFILSLLVISSLTASSAYPITSNIMPQHGVTEYSITQTDQQIIDQNAPRQLQVNLSEGFVMNTDNTTPPEQQNDLAQIQTVRKTVYLSEQIVMADNKIDKNMISAIKQISDKKATMERIWNSEKIRFNGKHIDIGDISWSDQTQSYEVANQKPFYTIHQIQKNIVDSLYITWAIKSPTYEIQNQVTAFFESVEPIRSNVTAIYDGIDPKELAMLLLLAPLTGHILIRRNSKHNWLDKIGTTRTNQHLWHDIKPRFLYIFNSKSLFSRLATFSVISVSILSIPITNVVADSVDQGTCDTGTGTCSALFDTTSIALTDTATAALSVSKSVTDSIALTDAVTARLSVSRSLADSIALTDAVSSTLSASKSVTDSIALTDTATAALSVSKSVTDSIALTDTATAALSVSKSVTDSIALTDTATAALSVSKSVTDSIALTDAVTARLSVSRSLADSIALTDAVSSTLSASKSVTDSIALTDTATAALSVSKSVTDSIALTDTATAALSVSKSVTDSIALTDTATAALSVSKSVTDSIALTDAVTATLSVSRSLADSIALTDAVSSTLSASKSVTDSIALTDTATAALSVSKSVTDSIALTDTATAALSVSKSVTDSIALTDAVTARLSVSRSLADSIALTDAVSSTLSASKSVTDSIALTDTATAALSVSKSVTDSIALTDTATAALSVSKSVTDSIALTDAVTATLSVSRSLADSIALTDAVSSTLSASKSVTDSIALTDTATAALSVSKSVTDSIALTDTATAALSVSKSVTDSIALTDAVTARLSVSKSVTDSIALTDTATARLSTSRSLADSIALTDQVTGVGLGSLSDSIALTDAVSSTLSASKSVTDSIALTDTATAALSVSKSVTDSIALTDTATAALSVSKSVTDSIALTDTATAALSVSKSVTDSIALTDTATAALSVSKSVTDSIALTDAVTARLSVSKSVTDSIALTDTATARLSTSRSLADSIALTDQVTGVGLGSLSDSIALTDAVTARLSVSRSLSDSIALTDQVIGVRSGELSNSVELSDQISRQVTQFRSLSDSINLAATAAPNLQPGQYLVENSQQTVTVDPTTPELLVLTSSAALSTITIPETVTEPTINYTAILSTGATNTVSITNSLTIQADTSNVDVEVIIPAGIIIEGSSSWTGKINLPTFKELTSVTPPTESETSNTMTSVIEVGFNNLELTFNKAVKLKFEDKGGQRVGYSRSGTFTEITSTCVSVNNEPANTAAMGAGGDCKITDGSDLIVWTKHFTSFGSFSSTSTPSSPSPSPGGGGKTNVAVGGGGSGGGSGGKLITEFRTGELKIYEISWDVCGANQANIIAGTDGDPRSLAVKIRTSSTGITKAILVDEQPFEEANKFSKAQRLLFIAPLNLDEKFFAVTAEDGVDAISELVDINECTGTITVSKFEEGQAIVKIPTGKETTPTTVEPPITIAPVETNKPELPATDNLLLVIKKWTGRTAETVSDSELLGAAGVEGEHIPSWFKKNAKWVFVGSVSEQEFVDALKYMSEKGLLSVEKIPKITEPIPSKVPVKEAPIETPIEVPVEEQDNLRTIIILSIVIAVSSLAIFVISKTKRPKVPTIKVTEIKTISEVTGKGITGTPQILSHKYDADTVTQRLDSREASYMIDEIENKFLQMNEEEILERISRSHEDSQYLLAIHPLCKKWHGVMEDGSSMKRISGNGAALIPFKGKRLTEYHIIYNVLIQKKNGGELIISIIKNGVPIDGIQTKDPLGSTSLIGEC